MSEFRKLVENILREGDKKIFNKNGPHYNSSKDEEGVFKLLKKNIQILFKTILTIDLFLLLLIDIFS